MTQPGRFITLEGGEGAGKSTLIQGLSAEFQRRNISVDITREPGGTPLAEEVRSLALNPPEDQAWSALSHALLMNTARRDHLEKRISPALEQGIWVLCDRFADSTRAYQSVDGVPVETLLALEQIVIGQCPGDQPLLSRHW